MACAALGRAPGEYCSSWETCVRETGHRGGAGLVALRGWEARAGQRGGEQNRQPRKDREAVEQRLSLARAHASQADKRALGLGCNGWLGDPERGCLQMLSLRHLSIQLANTASHMLLRRPTHQLYGVWGTPFAEDLGPRMRLDLRELELGVVRVHCVDLLACWCAQHFNDLHQLVDAALSWEEWLSQHQCVVRRAEYQLWRAVVARTDVRDVGLALDKLLRTPEVTQLQAVCGGVHQQILRLDVCRPRGGDVQLPQEGPRWGGQEQLSQEGPKGGRGACAVLDNCRTQGTAVHSHTFLVTIACLL
eukprot:365130-Chlamydomonas_euryale.AAC.31